jgi:hypothetical protein
VKALSCCRACGCTAFAVALSLATVPALAETLSSGSLSLEWRAPASCPDGAAVLERVQSLLAGSPESEPVQARGVVSERTPAGGWELTLETMQGARTWQRSLRASSCDEVTDAGALIVALLIDPSLQPDRVTDPASVPPAEPPNAKPPANDAEPPASGQAVEEPAQPEGRTSDERSALAAERRAHLSGHAAVSAIADWGSLPRLALGMELAGGFGVRPVEIEIVGTVLPPVEEMIAQDPDRGGNIGLLAGGLRGCYVLHFVDVSGRACAGLEAGRMQGEGFGTTEWTDTRNALWMAGRLGLFARYGLAGPIALRFGLEGLIRFTRPEFVLDNVGPVHEPKTAVGRLELGLELLFQ